MARSPRSKSGCQHDLCHCPEAQLLCGEARYCSSACSSEEARSWSSCGCGHPECATAAGARAEEPPGVSIAPGPGGCAPDPRAPLVPPLPPL